MSELLKLSPSEFGALVNIGKYKTLTSLQLADILGYTPKTMATALRKLKDKGLTEAIEYGVAYREGRLPALHFLKKKGVRVLQEEGEQKFEIPTGTFRIKASSFYHRAGVIDIQIALDKHLEKTGNEVLFYDKDFDFVGANRGGDDGKTRQPKTKIYLGSEDDFIIPDSVFCVEKETGGRAFCLVEYHRGKDAKRLISQLEIHALSLMTGYTKKKYSAYMGEEAPQVLAVCEEEATKRNVARRIVEESNLPNEAKSLFAFATLDDVKKDFSTAFKTLNNTPFTL